MVDEEIVTSLKNAIERDEDIEEAAQTLINAGYSPQEVNEARDFIQRGVLASEAKTAEEDKIKNAPPKPSMFSSLAGKLKSVISKKAENEIPKPANDVKPLPVVGEETQKIPKLRTIPYRPSAVPAPQSPQSERNTFLIVAVIILIILIVLLSLAIIFKNSIMGLFG